MSKRCGATEYADERCFGKYCIDFAGPGGVLLGRVWWEWRAKRFRDSRSQIMAVAAERDRILKLAQGLVSEIRQKESNICVGVNLGKRRHSNDGALL
jgi:hypothetical protein